MIAESGKENVQYTCSKKEDFLLCDSVESFRKDQRDAPFLASERSLPRLRNILSDSVPASTNERNNTLKNPKIEPDLKVYSDEEKETSGKSNVDNLYGLPSAETARKYDSLFSWENNGFANSVRLNVDASSVADPLSNEFVRSDDTNVDWDAKHSSKVENIVYPELNFTYSDSKINQHDASDNSRAQFQFDNNLVRENIDSILSNFDECFFSEICGGNSGDFKNIFGLEMSQPYNPNDISFSDIVNTSILPQSNVYSKPFPVMTQEDQYNYGFAHDEGIPAPERSSKCKRSRRRYEKRAAKSLERREDKGRQIPSSFTREEVDYDSADSSFLCGCKYDKCIHLSEAKRMRHNMVERERRGDMRRCFDRIISLIPELNEMPSNRRSKLRVLQTTVKYINNYVSTKNFQLSLLKKKRQIIGEINSLLQENTNRNTAR